MSAAQQWYYAKGNQQLGPVDRAVLDDLVRRGEVGPADLVWTEGMVNWAAAGEVLGTPRPVMGPPATPAPPENPGGPLPYTGAPPAGAYPGYTPPLGYSPSVDGSTQKTLAILAIVFGSLGFLCCPVVFGVAGIVCGAVAVNKPGPHAQLAKTGLIIAIVGTVLGVGFSALWIGVSR